MEMQYLHPRYWPTWLGLGIAYPIAFLPWRLRRKMGELVGRLLYQNNKKRRNVILVNLKLCFPYLNETQREALAVRHSQEAVSALLDYALLFFRSREWVCSRIDWKGREHIDNAIRDKQNVMLLLGHSVWLEFASAAIGRDYQGYGSYKPVKNPLINSLILRSRMKDAEFVVARNEGMMKLVRMLKPGRLLVFLSDEDLGQKGSVFAPFFGVPKATLTTTARIARLGKATCLPIMAFFNNHTGRYEVCVDKPLEQYPSGNAEEDAATFNRGLENLIKQQPHQYMWILKLFRTQADGKKYYVF